MSQWLAMAFAVWRRVRAFFFGNEAISAAPVDAAYERWRRTLDWEQEPPAKVIYVAGFEEGLRARVGSEEGRGD